MNRKIKITILHKIALTHDSIAPASEIVYEKPGGHLLGAANTVIDNTPEPVLDLANLALDIAGLFPLGGEPFDITSGLLYLKRDQPLWAAMSAISVIPTVGDAVGKGFKLLYKALDNVKTLGTMYTVSNTFLVVQGVIENNRVEIEESLASLSILGGRDGSYLIAALDAGILDMENKINALG